MARACRRVAAILVVALAALTLAPHPASANAHFRHAAESIVQSVARMTAAPSGSGREGAMKAAVPAFAFDIDGVFKHASTSCQEGQRALRRVIELGLPYVFMTNGGNGKTEAEYAEGLMKQMNDLKAHPCYPKNPDRPVQGTAVIEESRMVLSYTPFRDLPAELKTKQVLIVGDQACMTAAKAYGFTDAIHINEYARRHPDMDPFSMRAAEDVFPYCPNTFGKLCDWNAENHTCDHPENPEWEDLAAVLIMADPNHQTQFLQIVTDVLMNNKPGSDEELSDTQIPIYINNRDMVFQDQFKHPRFAGGAFLLALKALYRARLELLGVPEDRIKERFNRFVQYGKPETRQYSFVENILEKQAEVNNQTITHFYMVGDNPDSDMEGARRADAVAKLAGTPRWGGLLVRTGVYKDGMDTHGATAVVTDVDAALDFALSHPTGLPQHD